MTSRTEIIRKKLKASLALLALNAATGVALDLLIRTIAPTCTVGMIGGWGAMYAFRTIEDQYSYTLDIRSGADRWRR
jgi:hypothetical protein